MLLQRPVVQLQRHELRKELDDMMYTHYRHIRPVEHAAIMATMAPFQSSLVELFQLADTIDRLRSQAAETLEPHVFRYYAVLRRFQHELRNYLPYRKCVRALLMSLPSLDRTRHMAYMTQQLHELQRMSQDPARSKWFDDPASAAKSLSSLWRYLQPGHALPDMRRLGHLLHPGRRCHSYSGSISVEKR